MKGDENAAIVVRENENVAVNPERATSSRISIKYGN